MHTLYARLRDDLRGRILDGRLAPHDKLPSESELTEAHGVSRITVRQALGDLQREGLIVRVQGKGAYVAPPRTSQSLNRLQGLGEALAGQGRVHSKRLSIRQLRAPAAVAGPLDLPPRGQAWRLETLRYLDREPLAVSTSWFGPELGQRIARLDLSGRDFIELLETELRRPVAQAELEITAIPAPAKEARLLQMSEGDAALRVHRLLRDADGLPLQVESACYRGDRFSYRLNLTR